MLSQPIVRRLLIALALISLGAILAAERAAPASGAFSKEKRVVARTQGLASL